VIPRPIVVCEASPAPPTVTVRARKVGTIVVRSVTADTLHEAAIVFALLSAPKGA
jgi:hypothetical protein